MNRVLALLPFAFAVTFPVAAEVKHPPEAPDVAEEISTIFFGSCLVPQRPHPIFDTINSALPDLFVFLGDNVYADTVSPKVMQGHYEALSRSAGFTSLIRKTPVVAVWDDHDFGMNDAGADYPMKEESERQFEAFWNLSHDGPAATRPGIYQSYLFGPPERRVQLILLDTRFFRSPLLRGGTRATHGPYRQNEDPDATILGDAQWRWFEAELERSAMVRVIASSIQVTASFHGWESWSNFIHEHSRFLDAVARRNGGAAIVVSGDRHFAEMSSVMLDDGTELVEVTSSALNRAYPGKVPSGNDNRIEGYYLGHNFGEIRISWSLPDPHIDLVISDAMGEPVLRHTVPL